MGRLLSDFKFCVWETIYEQASCLIRISGPLALHTLPCLPTSQNCVASTRNVGIHTSKSSFLLSDSAAEGTTSIVSNLLLGNRQSRSFNDTLSFLFPPLSFLHSSITPIASRLSSMSASSTVLFFRVPAPVPIPAVSLALGPRKP